MASKPIALHPLDARPVGHMQKPPRRTLRLSRALLGSVALAFGPWLVRLSDVGPVAAGFWRLMLALPFLFAVARR